MRQTRPLVLVLTLFALCLAGGVLLGGCYEEGSSTTVVEPPPPPPPPAPAAVASLRITTTVGSLRIVADCTRSTNAVRYNISFGDGNDDDSPNVTYTYAVAGTYDVRCRVWNSDGVEGQADATTVTVPPGFG